MTDSAVFFSDDMVLLAERLKTDLFPPGSRPFDQRVVIVPHHTMKTLIQREWAREDNLGIVAGVQFMEIPEVLRRLSQTQERKILPTSLQLALYLYSAATSLLRDNNRPLSELENFLGGKEERLFPLCEELASVFMDYGQYAEGQIEKWLQKGGWQALLWEEVFEKGPLTYPLQLLSSISWEVRPAIFGFLTLPTALTRFFKQCGANFFLFSPCAEYWGDFLSSSSYARKALFLQKKGIKEQEIARLDDYIEEQHPLLANWGSAGRFILDVLQTEEMQGDEDYREKESCIRLQQLQASILHLAPPNLAEDDSIEIVSAPNRLREIETLSDRLQALLQRHQADESPLLPKDILILAPDITFYAPYIQAVLGAEESPLDYAITGLERIQTSPLAQAQRRLLSLLEARFDTRALIDLFQTHVFREKFNWEEAEITLITRWIEKSGITWGYDGVQRAQITHSAAPLEEQGSWSFGLDRLLFGLTCEVDSGLPLLEWTDTDLFGQLIAIVEDLHRDAAYLIKDTKRTLCEWTAWIELTSDRYFHSKEEENWLHSALLQVVRASRPLEPLLLRFADFLRIVDAILNRRNGHCVNGDLQALRFASFAEGTVEPARVIYLIGMEEGSFPSADKRTSLCELPLQRPSKIACDRYLFLEACMKARDYLRISYVSRSVEEKIELMPSPLVQQLLDWLKKTDPKMDIIHIPSLAISQPSLELFPYFSSTRYEAAKSYYGNGNQLVIAPHIQPELPEDVWPETQEIKLEDLHDCLRNPLAFYFYQTLKFRLKREEEEDFAKEEFYSPSWKILDLARQSLFAPLDDVLGQARSKGEFPMGRFEQVARMRVTKKSLELRDQFALFEVAPDECFTAILSSCCKKPEQLDQKKLLLPPWKIVWENRSYSITGQLANLSSQGLVCFVENKLPALFPYWPHYLILAGHPDLRSLVPAALLPVAKQTKAKEKQVWAFANPQEEMLKLLLYVQKAKILISPFHAKWTSQFFGSQEKLEKLMKETHDPHVRWLLEQRGVSYLRNLCEVWRPYVKNTFASFLTD